MLNPFPQLLVYGFFAPTLLRGAVAFVLLFVATRTIQNAALIATKKFPLVGKVSAGVVRVGGMLTFPVALAVLAGYGTQWALLLSILIALKLIWLHKELEPAIPLSRFTYALFIVMCVSLLLTGAGGLAFDLPL